MGPSLGYNLTLLFYLVDFFFLTSVVALSSIFQTKRLVSNGIKATGYFLKILRSHKVV